MDIGMEREASKSGGSKPDEFDLDELKQAWRSLDAKLQRQNDLQFLALREQRVGRVRSALRPLFWGQIASMAFGLAMLLLGLGTWVPHWQIPHLLVAGLAMHVYGVATIAIGGVLCARILAIDYAEPVLALQQRLARIRRVYLIGGMWIGLPWWLLWIPFVMTLAASLLGLDLYAVAQGAGPLLNWIHLSLAVSALGLLGTWWFHRWLRKPGREALAGRMEDNAAGHSLRKARAELDELRRFSE